MKYPEPTVGAIIFNPDNKILLCKSHKWNNQYIIPGGHIELGEGMEEALPLSCKISHPAYDAMYLVTSRRKNATLVTLDKRLVRAAKSIDVPVAVIT